MKNFVRYILISAAFVLLLSVSAFSASVDIVDIKGEVGIRGKFATNSTDTRYIESEVYLDGETARIGTWSNTTSYYGDDKTIRLSLANDINIPVSDYSEITVEMYVASQTSRFPEWFVDGEVKSELCRLYVKTSDGLGSECAKFASYDTGMVFYSTVMSGKVFKYTTSDILGLVGEDDIIKNIEIRPYGDAEDFTETPSGAFRIIGLRIIGQTKDELSRSIDSGCRDSVGIVYTLDKTSCTASVRDGKSVSAESVSIPDSVVSGGVRYTVTSVSEDAFGGNTAITKVIIPKSVSSIGDGAFEGCVFLNGLYFEGTPPTKVGSDAFKNTSAALSVFYLPKNPGWGRVWNGYNVFSYGSDLGTDRNGDGKIDLIDMLYYANDGSGIVGIRIYTKLILG